MADMERSSKKRGKGRKTNSKTQTTRVPLRSLRSQRQFNDVRQDNPERNSQDDYQKSLQNHEIHDQQIHVPDKEKVTNEEGKDSSDESEENESETPRKYRKNDTDNLMPKAKKTTESEKEEYYIIPMKFLEKLNNQNKVLWKNQLKQEKRLEDIKQILLKIHREESLSPAFFKVNVVFSPRFKSLYPTPELFKEHFEVYIEKGSKGYINDIGRHRWDSRFYSEFMPICLDKMKNRRGILAKEIRATLFKTCNIPEIKTNSGAKITDWKKSPCVTEAYANLWKVDNTGLFVINGIIMKAMPKESKENCLTPSIISFALAVCCIVLNPHSDEIRCTEDAIKQRSSIFLVLLNEDTFPKESDISEIQEGSREMTNYNDNVEEISEDNDDARLFE
ncbi:uncharacterized protein OCT59_000983 [Rhizophagus irregularis]|nr:hypothetical protein OCT59_000983 [Rhizophagus irregularis]GBC28627.2 hypothetical protein GLOIN_2v1790251 [Rhizophagus irregularis DAOM 181602=DAOM 197198]